MYRNGVLNLILIKFTVLTRVVKCLKTLGIVSPSHNFLLKNSDVSYWGKLTNKTNDFKWTLEMLFIISQTRVAFNKHVVNCTSKF